MWKLLDRVKVASQTHGASTKRAETQELWLWYPLPASLRINFMLSIYIEPPALAQLVKNPPAMQETPVRFLGQEDPLEKGLATHSNILGLPL